MRVYTIAEAAAVFGVSPNTMKRRISEAGIRPSRIGRGIILTEADMAAVIEFCRTRSAAPEPLHPWTALSPEPVKPRGRLSRREQGRRVQEGKRRAAEFRRQFGWDRS